MDIPKCRSISSSRSKEGQLRRSARILPIVVVPTQLTPTRLTRNSDSSPPHRRSEGVRVRCQRYRGIGETADSQDSGGYAEELARTLPRRIPMGPDALQTTSATYMMYTRSMSENTMPLPYEVQEMTTTEARKHLPELVNMAAYGHVTTVLTRDGRRLARIVPEEDAWVYSPAWQDKLREADTDLAAGRVRRFEDDDDFLEHLEALDDEAGG